MNFTLSIKKSASSSPSNSPRSTTTSSKIVFTPTPPIRLAAAPPKPPCTASSPASARCFPPSWPSPPTKPGNSFPPAAAASVHLSQWQPGGLALPAGEQELWNNLLQHRNDLLPDLGSKRANPKPLENRSRPKSVYSRQNKPFSDWAADPAVLEAFRELCNVSHIEITARPKRANSGRPRRRPEMRALLALGNRRRLQPRSSRHLRPLRRGCQAARRLIGTSDPKFPGCFLTAKSLAR